MDKTKKPDNIVRPVIINRDMIKLADQEAKKLGMSFAAFMRLLLNQYFNGIRFERRRHNNDIEKE